MTILIIYTTFDSVDIATVTILCIFISLDYFIVKKKKNWLSIKNHDP